MATYDVVLRLVLIDSLQVSLHGRFYDSTVAAGLIRSI